MADDDNAKTPEEQAFLIALHQRKTVAGALDQGSLACLPKDGGYADTTPAVNIATGTVYHGANLLYLKAYTESAGFKKPEYMTAEAMEKSGFPPRRDEQDNAVNISFSQKNEAAGSWETKIVKLYNVEQSENPAALREHAAKALENKQLEKQEYLKNKLGENYKEYAPREKKEGPQVICASTKPEVYLGQYLAAVSLGGKFKVTPEQAKEFSDNLKEKLYTKMENGRTNPFALSKICNAASERCKVEMKAINMEQRIVRKEQAAEKKQSQGQSRGRSM